MERTRLTSSTGTSPTDQSYEANRARMTSRLAALSMASRLKAPRGEQSLEAQPADEQQTGQQT